MIFGAAAAAVVLVFGGSVSLPKPVELPQSVCVPTSQEKYIIVHESGGNTHSWNPIATSTGHAFGLGQLTDENRAAIGTKLGINPDTTNYCDQLELMRGYVHERYGTTQNAYDQEVNEGWY